MYKNLDSPHPLTPSPIFGIRGTRIISISLLSHLWEKGELELSLSSHIFGIRGTRIISPLSHL
jgi:hypothetical protein